MARLIPAVNALRRHQLAHPKPAETVLGESAIACGCDAQLHRSVMFEPAGPRGMHACMSCGAVSCSEIRGDDGRHTGRSCSVYFLVEINQDTFQWLAAWPRVNVLNSHALWPMPSSWMRRDTVYLPVKLRCKTVEKLAAKEAELFQEQCTQTMRQRLEDCGFPDKPPPGDLMREFVPFGELWQDLQLTPDSDLQHLMARADAGSMVAAELLAQRGDAADVLKQSLLAGKAEVALHMLRASLKPPPDLGDVLIEVMNAVPMTPRADMPDRIAQWHHVEMPLIILAENRLNSPVVSAGLRALMRKVVRHDLTLADRVRTALREVETPSAS